MLAGLDARHGQLAAVLDGTGGVHDRVDLLGAARRPLWSSVNTGTPAASDASVSTRVLTRASASDAGLDVGSLGLCDSSVHHRRDGHTRGGVGDLVDQTTAHEARTDDGDPDRAALGLAPLQSGVDDDHASAPTFSGSQP